MSKAAVQQRAEDKSWTRSARGRKKRALFPLRCREENISPRNVTFLLPACTWGPWTSVLLLKAICIKPWKEGEGRRRRRAFLERLGCRPAAIATGAQRCCWRHQTHSLKNISGTFVSLFRRRVSLLGILLNWAQITRRFGLRWEQTKDPY